MSVRIVSGAPATAAQDAKRRAAERAMRHAGRVRFALMILSGALERRRDGGDLDFGEGLLLQELPRALFEGDAIGGQDRDGALERLVGDVAHGAIDGSRGVLAVVALGR